MASGHANRANRPNTWLHRPATRREVLTCQPGAVHTWHLADIDADDEHVCFWGVKRTSLIGWPMSANDPKRTFAA